MSELKVNEGGEMKPELLPCPLCGNPLKILENGLAWCRNLIEDPTTYVEWAEGSCLLAVRSTFLPVEVWQQLNSRSDLVTRPPEWAREAAHEIWKWWFDRGYAVNGEHIDFFTAIILKHEKGESDGQR